MKILTFHIKVGMSLKLKPNLTKRSSWLFQCLAYCAAKPVLANQPPLNNDHM
jgi:hypothetical protein